jgi:hypothetical protein
MGTAVCIHCGALKGSPFDDCPHCHFNPQGCHRAMAQSLILSSEYYDDDEDRRPSKEELTNASLTIKAGGMIDWDERELARLIDEQRVLQKEGSPSWLRIALLLLVIFLCLF